MELNFDSIIKKVCINCYAELNDDNKNWMMKYSSKSYKDLDLYLCNDCFEKEIREQNILSSAINKIPDWRTFVLKCGLCDKYGIKKQMPRCESCDNKHHFNCIKHDNIFYRDYKLIYVCEQCTLNN